MSHPSANSNSGFANPFCVLGISADADGPAIQQAAKRAIMERRLRGDSPDAERETKMIERAAEVLADPVERFRASLHWVTLDEAESKGWASQAEVKRLAFDRSILVSNDYEKVASIASVTLRAHNVAVLACADAERLAEAGDLEGAARSWGRGFQYWSTCLASQAFKDTMLDRARALEDPRLTRRLILSEIDSLMGQLLTRPAELAAEALRMRRTGEALGLVELVRRAPFADSLKNAALQTVYVPIATRIDREVKHLHESLNSLTKEAASCQSKVEGISSLLERFGSEVLPDLNQMMKLGDLPGLHEEHSRDGAARFANRLGCAAFEIDQISTARQCLRMASYFAIDPALRSTIAQNLSAAENASLRKRLEEVEKLVAEGQLTPALGSVIKLRDKATSWEMRAYLSEYEHTIRQLMMDGRKIRSGHSTGAQTTDRRKSRPKTVSRPAFTTRAANPLSTINNVLVWIITVILMVVALSSCVHTCASET